MAILILVAKMPVLKVEGDNGVPTHAAKELHSIRTWASDWLSRYRKEGLERLRNRSQSG